jgi:hypothetical protein
MTIFKRTLSAAIAIGLTLGIVFMMKEIIFLRHGLYEPKIIAMGCEVAVFGLILTKFAMPEVVTFFELVIRIIFPRSKPSSVAEPIQRAASLKESVPWLLVGAGGSLAILLAFVKAFDRW